MARPQQLQPGQINPQSQPVSTFIEPGRKSDPKAARPELLPQTPQLNVVQQGGTTFVQGENKFAQLTEDLKTFSPQLEKAAESAGLKYVDWRMDVGEQMAMEEVQRGLAQVDEQMEVAGNERAADNRKVSAVDPQAGWLMRTLDPYQQMGYQRGKVKMAGQQIALGLPSFIAQNQDQIDFTADDMGMGAIQRLQAQYQMQLEGRYGINSSSPGYSKYFAPNLIRAQDRVAQQIIEDRTTFFENEIGPQAITQTLENFNFYANNRLPITAQDGTEIPYTVADPADETQAIINPAWIEAMSWNASNDFKDLVARAPLGMASTIAKDLYVEAAKQFPEGSLQRKILDRMKGPDGKTFVSKYGYLAREASVQYASDEIKIQRNQRALLELQYRDEFRINLDMGFDAGAASQRAVESINGRRSEQGLAPLSPLEVSRLRAQGVREIGEIAPQRPPTGALPPTDPAAAGQYTNELLNTSIYDIDVPGARARLRGLAGSLTAEGQTAYNAAVRRVNEAEEAQKEKNTWVGKYGTDLQGRIDGLLSDSKIILFGSDVQRSNDLIKVEATNRMTARLKALAQSQEGPVTQEQINSELVDVWTGLSKEVLDGKFEIPGYLGGQSTNTTGPKPLPVEPAAGSNKPAPQAAVDLNQLGNFPRRNNRLRNWRNESDPILSASALMTIIRDAAAGRKENSAFTKAWKQAGAPNAWAFIERQMKYYPQLGKDGKGWTQEQLQKAKQDLLSLEVLKGNQLATERLMGISPAMAYFSDWRSEMA